LVSRRWCRSRRIGRLTTLSSRPSVALRTALFAVANGLGPHLVLGSLDGIAGWRPSQPPYAAPGSPDAP
jgi:hypothetical protein